MLRKIFRKISLIWYERQMWLRNQIVYVAMYHFIQKKSLGWPVKLS